MNQRHACILAAAALATVAGAAELRLRTSLETSGGDAAESTTLLRSAVHEPAVGESAASGFVLRSGFLAAPAAPAAPVVGDAWAIH